MNTPTPVLPMTAVVPQSPFDPFDLFGSSLAVQRAWLRQPERLTATLQDLALDAVRVHSRLTRAGCGVPCDPEVAAVRFDERFQQQAWTDQPWFAYLKESYLLYSRWLENAIYATEDVDPQQRRRAGFWTPAMAGCHRPDQLFLDQPRSLEPRQCQSGRQCSTRLATLAGRRCR